MTSFIEHKMASGSIHFGVLKTKKLPYFALKNGISRTWHKSQGENIIMALLFSPLSR
jgi:hypothetical protein